MQTVAQRQDGDREKQHPDRAQTGNHQTPPLMSNTGIEPSCFDRIERFDQSGIKGLDYKCLERFLVAKVEQLSREAL